METTVKWTKKAIENKDKKLDLFHHLHAIASDGNEEILDLNDYTVWNRFGVKISVKGTYLIQYGYLEYNNEIKNCDHDWASDYSMNFEDWDGEMVCLKCGVKAMQDENGKASMNLLKLMDEYINRK